MNLAGHTLKAALEKQAIEILKLLKALANKQRFLILLSLLEGAQSFQSLLHGSGLKKTALSNHLNHLTSSHLIFKPDYGMYKLSFDGFDYLSGLHKLWQQSVVSKQTQIHSIQSRGMSKLFLENYFRHEK